VSHHIVAAATLTVLSLAIFYAVRMVPVGWWWV
jgi:hypothetical protein